MFINIVRSSIATKLVTYYDKTLFCIILQSAEKFVKQAQTNSSLDIKFPGTFNDDPTVLLRDYKVK